MNVRQLLSRLADVNDFLFWQHKLASIQGFLADLEGYALLLLAAGGPGVGEIVELGSYLGRSTAFLAAGSKMAGREMVAAVDHFKGSPEHQVGQPHQSQVLLAEGTTYHQFLNNLRRVELLDRVNPVAATSEEAASRWNRPIRLLFIDGDHSYPASKNDFQLWSPFVVANGLICFHDVNVWPGVTQFYNELMKTPVGYQEIATVCSLKVIQKR